jgi:peptidase A4-like protein
MRILQWNLPVRGGHRRVPELLAAVTLAAACATGAALPAAAATTTTIPGPAVNFAPHGAHGAPAKLITPSSHPTTVIKNVVSGNWAGYASIATPKYTEVSSTWTEPSASCTSTTSYASFWTGLDGYNSASVEQTGTLVYCYGGVAYQYAWYEMYPAAPVYYNVPIAAGDRMTATVTSSTVGNFSLVLSDATRGWTATTTATNSSLARASAEVIAEAPSSSTGVLPLANFGTVTFTNSTVNNVPLASASPINIQMGSNPVKVLCSGISSGGAFSCTWYHA